jgi:hypothetical protein
MQDAVSAFAAGQFKCPGDHILGRMDDHLGRDWKS